MHSRSSTQRRNAIIRSVAGVTGDITIGIALASTCIWIINTAALGLFLSFLVWLIGTLVGLAISQYAVYPAINFALSDRKLDRGVEVLSAWAARANAITKDAGAPAWQQLRRGLTRFAAGQTAM